MAESRAEEGPGLAPEAEAFRPRRFGSRPADLAIDFDDPLEPRLVTALLAACLSDEEELSPEPARLWELPVGRRIEWLLRIAALEEEAGGGRLVLPLRCLEPDCAALLEIELVIDEIAAAAGESERALAVEHEGRVIPLRRPTAKDQLRWLRAGFPDRRAAARAIAASLMVESEDMPDDALADAVETVLEAQDPLVNFAVALDCPDCGLSQERRVDLCAIALARLRRAQGALLESVHRLASRYHWSEEAILALPPWRLRRYLALIEQEALL